MQSRATTLVSLAIVVLFVAPTPLALVQASTGDESQTPSSAPASSPRSSSPASAPSAPRIDPTLYSVLRGRGHDPIAVTLVFRESSAPLPDDREDAAAARAAEAERTQRSVLERLETAKETGDASGVTPLWGVNAITVSVTPALLRELSHRSDLASIWKAGTGTVSLAGEDAMRSSILGSLLRSRHGRFSPEQVANASRPNGLVRVALPSPGASLEPDWSQSWIDDAPLWQRDATGQGVTIAHLDTGVWGANPEIGDAVVSFLDLTRDPDDRASGTYAWHARAGTYATLSRSVDLTDATSASVQFRSWSDEYDCYTPQVETNCPFAGLYVDVPTVDGGVASTLAWNETGRSSGPADVNVDLTPYVGHVVTLRFYQNARWGSNGHDGWFLDEVAVVADDAVLVTQDAESPLDASWSDDGFARWTKETYARPMFASGNGVGSLVAYSPSYDLTGVDGLAVHLTYFSDLDGGCDYWWCDSGNTVQFFTSTDGGATWWTNSWYTNFDRGTDEDLRDASFYVGNLSGQTDVRFAIGICSGAGDGHPDNPGLDQCGTFGDRRGFGLAAFSIDGLPSASTDFRADSPFAGWIGTGGFGLRAIKDVAYDDDGHGTATAGIIVADGSQGWHRGIAPNASLRVVKVFDETGRGSERDLLRAYEWVATQPDVSILSYSGGSFYSDEFDAWNEYWDEFGALPNGTVADYPFTVYDDTQRPATSVLGYAEYWTPDAEYDAWDVEDPYPLQAVFIDPHGNEHAGVSADWVVGPYNGNLSDAGNHVWYHKLTLDQPLPAGEWTLRGRYDPATHPAVYDGARSMWSGQGDSLCDGAYWWQCRDTETSTLRQEFDLSDVTGANLSFTARWNTESYNDCVRVLVDDGAGTTFDSADGYDCWDYSDYHYHDNGYFYDHYAYSGWSDGWKHLTLDLGALFAGKSRVNVTFQYEYDHWGDGEGFYLDDVGFDEKPTTFTGFESDDGGWIAETGKGTTWHTVDHNEAKVGMYADVVVTYADDGTSPQALAVDHLAQAGILPVVAAGNDGGEEDCWPCGPTGSHTINTPAAARLAYAVGSTRHEHDLVSSFSSRGPVGFGATAYAKPDIAAPGEDVRSIGNGLGSSSYYTGTSFAAPQVAGVAALLLQADPTLRAGLPGSVTSLLNATAYDVLPAGLDNDTGHGRLDAFAALAATGHLPPLVDSTTASTGHELYAGTMGPETYWYPWAPGISYPYDYLPSLLVDPQGDGHDTDLVGVDLQATDATGRAFNLDVRANRTTTDQRETVAFDLDLDESTGDGGVDVRIVLPPSSEGNSAIVETWNADTSSWDATQTGYGIARYGNDRLVYGMPSSLIGATNGLVRFRVFANISDANGETDRAPDAGWASYPPLVRTMRASAFSFDQATHAPQAGAHVTFELRAIPEAYDAYCRYGYWMSPDTCYSTLLATGSGVTDALGRVTQDLEIDANRSYAGFLAVITDEYGNRARQAYMPAFYLPYVQSPPGSSEANDDIIVPANTYYPYVHETRPDGSVSIARELVHAASYTPYVGTAQAVIDPACRGDGTLVTPEIDVTDGVFRYDVPGSDMPTDPCRFYYVTLYTPNATSPQYSQWGGYVQNLTSENEMDIEMFPEFAAALPGGLADFSVLLSNESTNVESPRAGRVNVTAEWIRDVDVAGLLASLPRDAGERLARAAHASTPAEARAALSSEDARLVRVALHERPQDYASLTTTFSVDVGARGLQSFQVPVPTGRVLFGWVEVDDAECDCDTDGLIVVPATLAAIGEHHSAPAVEPSYDVMGLGLSWDLVDDHASDTITASVSVGRVTGNTYAFVSGRHVWIYLATGDVQEVVTDQNGHASATFAAPVVDAVHASTFQRYVDGWAVSDLVASDGTALAAKSSAYLPTPSVPSDPATNPPDLHILTNVADGAFHGTLRWVDGSGAPAPHHPTAVNVYHSTWGWPYVDEFGTAQVVDSPTGEATFAMPIDRPGAYTISADSGPFAGVRLASENVPDFRVDGPALDWQYSTNELVPLAFRVTDFSGAPLAGADMWLAVTTDEWCYPSLDDGGDGGDSVRAHGCLAPAERAYSRMLHAVTDADGRATVSMRAPPVADVWTDLDLIVVNDTRMVRDWSQSFYTMPGESLPELTVDLQDLPLVARVGQEVAFQAVVRNDGTAAASATTLRVEVNGETTRTVDVAALSAGDTQVVPLALTPATAGSYHVVVTVDPANDILESIEDDNADEGTLDARLPNLAVGGVTLVGPTAVSGLTTYANLQQVYLVRATITNDATVPTAGFRVVVKDGDATLATIDLSGLAGGESTIVSGAWTPATTGDHKLTVLADTLNALVESSKSDNKAAKIVRVLRAPDLGLRLNAAVPPTARIHTAIPFSFRVANVGGSPTTLATTLEFTMDGETTTQTVPALAAGETLDVAISRTLDSPGAHAWTARVDGANIIAEFNESNNTIAGTITGRYADLVAHVLTADQGVEGIGQDVTVSVLNTGNWPSDATTLDVYGPHGQLIQRGLAVPARNPGQGSTFELAWTPQHETEETQPVTAILAGGDDLSGGNTAVLLVRVQPVRVTDVCIHAPNPTLPEAVTGIVTFTTNVAGPATLTLRGAGGVEAGPLEQALQTRVGQNALSFRMSSVALGASSIHADVLVGAVTASADTGTTGCNAAPLRVLAKPVVLKDVNSSVVTGTATVTQTLKTFDVDTVSQDFVLDVHGGAQGRVLTGLAYLFYYPNGCVEQTTSPLLAALEVRQYYVRRGTYDALPADQRLRIEGAITSGVGILTTGFNGQHADGSWSMWSGGAPSNFYSAWALYGLMTAADDPTYETAVLDHMSVPNAVTFLAGRQAADGSWAEEPNVHFLGGSVPLTSLIMIDLMMAREHTTDEATLATIDSTIAKAADYLTAHQSTADDSARHGGWRPGGSTGSTDASDPFSTGYALYALALAKNGGRFDGDRLGAVETAITNATSFLEDRQSATDGLWTRVFETTSFDAYWWTNGQRAETGGVVLMGLHEGGRDLLATSVVNGVSGLLGIYRDGGSFGYTRATQSAIQALTVLQPSDVGASDVVVTVDGVRVGTVHVGESSPVCQLRLGTTVEADDACDVTLEDGLSFPNLQGDGDPTHATVDHQIVYEATGTARLLLASYDRQTADYDSIMSHDPAIPAQYIDPIADPATQFDMELEWTGTPAQGVESEFIAHFWNNYTPAVPLLAPAIALPLEGHFEPGTTAATLGGAAVHTELVNGVYYVEPEFLPSGASEVHFFLTPTTGGTVTLTGNAYPMYNDQLIAPSSATRDVTGRGTLAANVLTTSGGASSATLSAGGASDAGATPSVSLVQGAYAATVSATGKPTMTLAGVGVTRDATTTLTARFPDASTYLPFVALTSAATASVIPTLDATREDTNVRTLTMAYSASGGASLVGVPLPAGATVLTAPEGTTTSAGTILVPVAGASATLTLTMQMPAVTPEPTPTTPADVGSGTLAVTILDAATGSELEGAITVNGATTEGLAPSMLLSPGTYAVAVSAPGHVSALLTATITDGETTALTARLATTPTTTSEGAGAGTGSGGSTGGTVIVTVPAEPFARTASSATLAKARAATGLAFAQPFGADDKDHDGKVESFVDPSGQLAQLRPAIQMGGGAWFLVARAGSGAPAFLYDSEHDAIVPVTPTTPTVAPTLAPAGASAPGQVVATLTIEKGSGWVYMDVADPASADATLVEVRTNDGRTIPADHVWRADGRIAILDDPTTVYSVVYDTHDAAAPTVTIVTPAEGQTVSGAFTVTVSATDAASGVAKVELYANGEKVGELASAPYAFTVDASKLAGTIELKALATDKVGNVGTAIVHAKVGTIAPPTPTTPTATQTPPLAPTPLERTSITATPTTSATPGETTDKGRSFLPAPGAGEALLVALGAAGVVLALRRRKGEE